MTLIITELSELGIAMVADSAVTYEERTPSGDTVHRVLNGVQKLQVIPYLSTGISMWGLGSIQTSVGPVSTDLWIGDFIQRHAAVRSMDDLANQLAGELQEVVGDVQTPLGFHLPGYVEQDGKRLPAFYHVRNVDGTYGHYEYHEFIPGQDFAPRGLNRGEVYQTRNGDYGPYAIIAQAVEDVLPLIGTATRMNIPHPSLHGRVAYLIAWLRFVSDLYASAGQLRTIGGSILALGITPEGQVVSYPT